VSQYVDLRGVVPIEAQAELVLASFRKQVGFLTVPPVPVEEVAGVLFGLKALIGRSSKRRTRTVAGLCVKDKTVVLDERHTRHQQLFALAHEVGHLVLHEGTPLSQLRYSDSQVIPIRALLPSVQARSKAKRATLQETEANRFAEALLVPRADVLKAAASYRVIDEMAIRDLARRFDVSPEVLLCRIENLNRHLAWNGPHVLWESLDRLKASWNEEGVHSVLDEPREASMTWPGGRLPHSRREAESALMSAVRVVCDSSAAAMLVSDSNDAAASAGGRPFRNGLPPSSASNHCLGKGTVDYCRVQRREQGPRSGVTRPVVVEFAGTPNAGKDTLIGAVRDYLEDAHGYKVRVVPESIGAASCIDKALDVDRLCKSIALTVVRLHEARFENPGNCDFVIFNRGIVDAMAFVDAMCEGDRISPHQAQVHFDYLLNYTHLQDYVFFLLISPEESLRREVATNRSVVRALSAERNVLDSLTGLTDQRIVNSLMLQRLNRAYLRAFEMQAAASNGRVTMFDSTQATDTTVLAKARAVTQALVPSPISPLPLKAMLGPTRPIACGPVGHERATSSCGQRVRTPEAGQLALAWP
jgi:Zn-dependent peptidase ImmA (M78 family)